MRVEFKGGKQLEAALRELGLSFAQNRGIARRALDKAAQPIRDEWAANVDVQERDLQRSIKIGNRAQTKATRKFKRGTGKDIVERFIGIDPTEDKEGRLAAGNGSPGYAFIEEFGLHNHKPNPAGRRAWESKKQESFDRLADDLREEIDKAAKRVAKRGAK